MAIQGSLEEAALPDVIQLLALGRKTGCLSLTERDMQGEICLEQGRVCHAAVFGRRDRLGDMLVRTGRVTQQQLDRAIADHRAGGKRVSETLLESGHVARPELELYIRRQVEEAVYFMFTWRTGSFAFTSSVRPKHQDIPVSIDPEGLLLEGARRVDEWSLIEKKVPSLNLVFRVDRERLDAAVPALTEEQKQLIPVIDGSRDVNALIELTAMAEFTVGKALFGLISAGFVSRVERRAAMRHLDYREMLAYVVREAEFADPEKRRAAARHIADCATCTQRLKTIHVRRTGTIPSFRTPAEAEAAADAGEGWGDAGPDPATLATQRVERRAADRRSGEERRQVDRRHGERRVARSAEWEQPGRDRRSGNDRRAESRRVAERRLSVADWQQTAIAAALRPATVPPRTRPGGRRSTGPRRIRPQDPARQSRRRNTGDGIRLQPADDAAPVVETAAHERDRPEPSSAEGETARPTARPSLPPVDPSTPPPAPETAGAAPAVKPPKGPPARSARTGTDVARKAPAPRQPPDPDIPEPSDDGTGAEASARPLPASVAPHPRPQPLPRGGRTKDLAWLVSPAEADDLIRTTRSAEPAGAEPARTPAPPRPEAGSARRAEPGRSDTRQVAPSEKTAKPAPTRAAAAPGTPERAPQTLADRPARPASAPVPRAEPEAQPVPRRAAPVAEVARLKLGRWMGLAVAVIVLTGVALAVGPSLGVGGADRPSPAAPVALAPPAAQQPAEAAPAVTTPGGDAEAASASVTAPAPPARDPVRPAASPPPQRLPEQVSATPAPAGQAASPTAAEPTPVPTVGIVRGVVRDAESGAGLAGVSITIPGTPLAATTDASGAYTLPDVPAGRIAVSAARDGRIPERREVMLERGSTTAVDFALAAPEPAPPADPPPARVAEPTAASPAVAPAAREPDDDLASGSWTMSDAAAAAALLRTGLATIPGLWVESVAIVEGASRPRVRVALLTPAGERIVLTETRSGAPTLPGAPRVTALRIIPASGAYPLTTGTASFGSLLVTAKASLSGDALRALLATLAPLE